MAQAQAPLPSHGQAKGYLVITGGGPDYKNFLALAGGNNAAAERCGGKTGCR